MSHDISEDLATSLRSLGVDLFNQYDMLELSDKITKILQKAFDELPEIMLHLQEDSESIKSIIVDRRETYQRKKEWEREITYEADLGILIKDKLSISPKGVQWKDTLYPLDSITRVRWGGVSHSLNGIPTGTSYTIAFGDQFRETVVNIGKRNVYSAFIEKLWLAVCVRLLTEYLEKFKAGERIFFGDAAVDDLGISLTRHKFLASENVYCKWEDTSIWSANGSFIIGAKNDKKTYVEISYIEVPNTHILESIVRMSFKKWKGRLSGLKEDE